MKTTNFILFNGYKPILISFVIFLVLFFLGFDFLSFVMFIVTAIYIVYYLNPEREPEEMDPLAIIAPIDGKITAINPHSDKVEIVISNFFTDIHVIRAPFDCVIEKTKKFTGTNLVLSNPNAKALNTKLCIGFEKNGHKFSLNLTSSIFKIKNLLFFTEGSLIRLARRIGFFSGGEAVFICPINVDLKVSVGDNLKGAKTLIGFIRR